MHLSATDGLVMGLSFRFLPADFAWSPGFSILPTRQYPILSLLPIVIYYVNSRKNLVADRKTGFVLDPREEEEEENRTQMATE